MLHSGQRTAGPGERGREAEGAGMEKRALRRTMRRAATRRSPRPRGARRLRAGCRRRSVPLSTWGAIPGRRQTEIAVLALLERGACAFALSRTGRGELLHGVSVLHVPEAIQNARVIGAIARLKHRPVSIELVTCIAHEACRGRIPASSQRVEDALVVPLTGCLCAVVPSDSAARARQTQKGPRPIARCAALPLLRRMRFVTPACAS